MNTKTLDAIKLNLIVRISKLDNEESVRQVEKIIDLVEHQPSKKQSNLLKKLAKPLRKKIDLEALKREQNWKPINREEFDNSVRQLDIQEPLEQLIADIGK